MREAVDAGAGIDNSGRLFLDAVIVKVAGDADDFVPLSIPSDIDAFSQSRCGATPQLASHVLRYDRHWVAFVHVGPGEIVPHDDRRSLCFEETGRDDFVPANRRDLSATSYDYPST